MNKQKFLDSLAWQEFEGSFEDLTEIIQKEGHRPCVVQFADSKTDSFEYVGDCNSDCPMCGRGFPYEAQVSRYAFLWRGEK